MQTHLSTGRSEINRRGFLRAIASGVPLACAAPSLVWGNSPPVPSLASVMHSIRARVDLRRRDRWAGEEPVWRRLRRVDAYSRITVHHAGCGVNFHTQEAEVAYDIESIRVGHLARRFGDIGYHFVVDRAGRVWEGRSLQYMGAHVSHENEQNIGLMLLGNFEEQQPASRQLEALASLTGVLRRRFGIAPRQVYGHRDLGHTLCPGRHLYGQVGRLRRA